MEIKKKKISDAQKRAQKRYDEKTKTIAVKYTPANMDEYEQLMQYLSDTKQNKNSFLKKLIKEHLCNIKEEPLKTGMVEKKKIETNKKKVEEKLSEHRIFCPYKGIRESCLQFMYRNFKEEDIDNLLAIYAFQLENEVDKYAKRRTEEFNKIIATAISDAEDNLRKDKNNKKYILQNTIDKIRSYIEN